MRLPRPRRRIRELEARVDWLERRVTDATTVEAIIRRASGERYLRPVR